MDFKKISLDSVSPSPMNPRKTFDEAAVKELADNIDKQGLIQPITVRPSKLEDYIDEDTGEVVSVPSAYEIVCGERRYRAFRLLKEKEDELNIKRAYAHWKKYDRFQSIPAIVREMTDEEAFEAMITENLQRQDVDPMEEAFAFGQLIKNGKTVEDVANKFGKSTRFVQDRVKLNTLIPELVVAVKDDKMSISAAMIICKLDEDTQRKYFSQYQNNYQGFSKSSAENFVNNLFMDISSAPWNKSDNQADEEFTGGCDRACSKCQFNTANHGCLFWEMKSKDAGRCTEREKYKSKILAYLLKVVDENASCLVLKDQPLTKGKTVVCMREESYFSDSTKALHESFRTEVERRGYEIVSPNIFKSQCWYKSDDERVADMLKTGEIYRVLYLCGYDVPCLEESFYYVKSNDLSTNSDENGVPAKVSELISKYNEAKNLLSSNLAVQGCKAITEYGKIDSKRGLDTPEFNLAYALMIRVDKKLQLELNLPVPCKDEDIIKFVEKNKDPHVCVQIMRGWVRNLLTSSCYINQNDVLHLAEPYLDGLGELWCPTEYQEAIEKVKSKFEKTEKKIVGQLKALGYDINGNKLTEDKAAQ